MRARGFTLLELVIALAIVGILATIALPSYQSYVYRAKAVEVVLFLDKVKGALAIHEADRNLRLGSDLLINGSSSDREIYSSTSTGTPGVVASLRPADLVLARQHLKAQLVSGSRNTNSPGQYKVVLTWPGAAQTSPEAALEGRQIALAVADIMRPNVPKIEYATRSVSIHFQLSGTQKPASSAVTPPQPPVTSTPAVVTPPSQPSVTTPSVISPPPQPSTTTSTGTPPSTTVTPPSTTVTPPSGTVTPPSQGTTTSPTVVPPSQNHPGNHGHGFAKGHNK